MWPSFATALRERLGEYVEKDEPLGVPGWARLCLLTFVPKRALLSCVLLVTHVCVCVRVRVGMQIYIGNLYWTSDRAGSHSVDGMLLVCTAGSPRGGLRWPANLQLVLH